MYQKLVIFKGLQGLWSTAVYGEIWQKTDYDSAALTS